MMAVNNEVHTLEKIWNLRTNPHLKPMKVDVNINEEGKSPGYYFLGPHALTKDDLIGQTSVMIMDDEGNPVWFHPADEFTQIMNFRTQTYKGEPVLTLWQGTLAESEIRPKPLPYGDPLPGAVFQIYNQNYQLIKNVNAQKGYVSDFHEFLITERGTAIILGLKQIPADLSKYGGPENGYIDDYSVQEIDIETGELLFFWDALSHINPADSVEPVPDKDDYLPIWDPYHLNSIEEGPDGTLLLSMKTMNALYKIDKETGQVIWQIGGKNSDFEVSSDAVFSNQHDARFISSDTISLFDNNKGDPENDPDGISRGLIIKVDEKNKKVEVDRTFYHDSPLYVGPEGGMSHQSDGNFTVGWGSGFHISEFGGQGNSVSDTDSNILFDATFPGGNLTYRAYKDEWTGLPLESPKIAVELDEENGAAVYVSWNGTTETAKWQVVGGKEAYLMEEIITVEKEGFETVINVQDSGPYFLVNALDENGNILGSSLTKHAEFF